MRLRLILSFVLIVLVTVTSVVLFARQGAAQEVRSFMLHGSMVATDELVAALENYYHQNGAWQGVSTVLGRAGRGFGPGGMGGMGGMMGQMMDQRLRLANADGRLVFDTQVNPPSGSLTPAEVNAAIPLQDNGQTVGYLLAEGGMAFNSTDETYLLGRITHAAWIAGLIAAGLSLLLAVVLTYSLLRPVRELTTAAGRLGRGDLSQRVRAAGDDEVAVLARAFNHMAASLQAAEESRRALTADIAHELRTPLAVQRAHLEALQDGIYPPTPENLAPVLEQNLTLTRLVDDLRTLALADAGQLALERVPADLTALVARTVERFTPQASSRDISLIFEPQIVPASSNLYPLTSDASTSTLDSRLLSLDPLRIEQILANLLTNALRHTPEGGKVRIRVSFTPATAQVTVHDSGPGIPAEALPFIFERFYRADRSRSRAEGGAGLGLAIARRLAEAHGGALTAENHAEGGALFTLTLPLT